MPEYMKNHAVYYAGPAKTPTGMASGSFGPTTAGRMDSYVDRFQKAGGSMIMTLHKETTYELDVTTVLQLLLKNLKDILYLLTSH